MRSISYLTLCLIFLHLGGLTASYFTSKDIRDRVSTAVWFLSQDGSDTPSCGRDEVSACRTLDWLLDRFCNATGHLNEKKLPLITDISLVINDILAQHYLSMENLTAILLAESKYNRPLSVLFDDVKLLSSNWSMFGFNLIMNNSDMSKSRILMRNTNKTKIGKAQISNSTFGYLEVSDNFDIHLSDSHINGSERLSATLINATGNTVMIANSTFWNLKAEQGPAVIKASRCKIRLSNVHFGKNVAPDGLIDISNQSNLFMKDGTFQQNSLISAAVVVKSYSSAECVNCVFDRNNGSLGSCFYSNTDSLNDDNYVMRLENSTFNNNTALKGGAIYFQQHGPQINTQQNTKSIAKAIRVPGCIIVNCSFEGNEAVFNGGAIYAQGATNKITKEKNMMSTVNIKSSRFSRNIGGSGGDIYINYNVSMSVDDSTFLDQSNAKNSIKTLNSCNITISGCTFTMKGLLFPLYRQFLLAITLDSNITIVNTIFQAERSIAPVNDFVMLTISKNAHVQVMNCTFIRANSILEAELGATISIADSTVVECFGDMLEKSIFSITNDVHLLLLNTEIKNNKYVDKHWAIVAEVNCTITISWLHFSKQ